MSRSIHVTLKGLRRDGLTKSDLEEMAKWPETEFTDLSKKTAYKRGVRESRERSTDHKHPGAEAPGVNDRDSE